MYLTQIKIDFPQSIVLKNMNVTHKFVESFFKHNSTNIKLKTYDIKYLKSGTVVLTIQSIDKPIECLQKNRPIKYASFIIKEYTTLFNNIIKNTNIISFELIANPVITKGKIKHQIIDQNEQKAWLSKQLSKKGFELLQINAENLIPYEVLKKHMTKTLKLNTVKYTGFLKIQNETLAKEEIIKGLSRSKPYGFGLLKIKNYVTV